MLFSSGGAWHLFHYSTTDPNMLTDNLGNHKCNDLWSLAQDAMDKLEAEVEDEEETEITDGEDKDEEENDVEVVNEEEEEEEEEDVVIHCPNAYTVMLEKLNRNRELQRSATAGQCIYA